MTTIAPAQNDLLFDTVMTLMDDADWTEFRRLADECVEAGHTLDGPELDCDCGQLVDQFWADLFQVAADCWVRALVSRPTARRGRGRHSAGF